MNKNRDDIDRRVEMTIITVWVVVAVTTIVGLVLTEMFL